MGDWEVTNATISMSIPLVEKPGASVETLMRRRTYGGRKGRRAARRLDALPRLTGQVWTLRHPETQAPSDARPKEIK